MLLQKVFNKPVFDALYQNVELGVVAINKTGEIEAANKYLLKLLDYCEDELISKKIECIIPERYRERHAGVRMKYGSTPKTGGANYCVLHADGREIPVGMSFGTLKENYEPFTLIFLIDLTQLRVAENTIRQLTDDLDQKIRESTRSLQATVDQLIGQIKENERKDAELVKSLEKEKELNVLKSRFVSFASHEFRTPLSGILASTYLLSKYTKEDQQPLRDKHIKRILSSVNLLNEVLSDFLSVDKMEQGDFRPNLTVFDINEVCNEIIQNIQFMLKNGQQICYRHNGPGSQAFIDHSMFQHILTNLLSNAIKYSPEGSNICLSVEHKDQQLIISVKDEGIGIPKQDQDKLFKRFFRSSNAAHIQGTGLGLNIVKKYVDALDGTITCRSEENRGTEFVMTFNNQKEQYENGIGS